MNIGLDVGYSATKAVAGGRRVAFPSAVGTPDRPRFSLGENHAIILTQPVHVQVGEAAVQQSRFLKRREDRRWIEGDEWYTLFLAALTEMTDATVAELRVVTGLPVAFYDDRQVLRARVLGEHRAQREGRRAQVFRVVDCRVIPQPFGILLAAALDDRGRIADPVLAGGTVGVLDIGGKTTNLLAVHRLNEIRRETASVNVGAWDAVRAMREWLSEHCPDLDLRDHQVIEAVIERRVRYYGEPVDLSRAVDAALEPLADQVIAAASQLWNGAAGLDAILVGGGGALLLGPYIQRHFRHARVVQDAVFANALGFWRFCQRLAGDAGNTR
ncbi:MAG: ParM/StbA family protein [Thermoflexales bacterium]|nr:ParM/StbA family protein [Thermoflexales bacterium]